MPQYLIDLIDYLPTQHIPAQLSDEILGLISILLLVVLLTRLFKRKKAAMTEAAEDTEAEFYETSAGERLEPPALMEAHGELPAAPPRPTEPPAPAPPKPKPAALKKPTVSLMDRLKSGLGKTRQSLTGRLESIFAENRPIDEAALEEIEEALITADVGVDTTMSLVERIRENQSKISNSEGLRTFLKTEMLEFFDQPADETVSVKPHVTMVVGVNGVGKTTTIGKIAYKYQDAGEKVLLGAADTFRAAAVEQLEIWANRADVDIVKHRENADPAAVAFDTVEAALARNVDRVIIDTAGRLHTKVNLMEQLKKIKRSIDKKMPGAPHEILLVLDATTGQNAISQAKLFHEGIGVTGLVLTKLDGTAKGGIVVGITHTMKLPLRYIGVGEAIEDLQPFNPKRFIDALF